MAVEDCLQLPLDGGEGVCHVGATGPPTTCRGSWEGGSTTKDYWDYGGHDMTSDVSTTDDRGEVCSVATVVCKVFFAGLLCDGT